MVAFAKPSDTEVIAQLTQSARTDVDDRAVLADLYDERGRGDVAALWRDALPDREHTRKRVDTMTQEETARLTLWRDEWIQIALTTGRADRPLFEAAVCAIYRAMAIPAPPVIWTEAPIVAVLAGPIASYLVVRASDPNVAVESAVKSAVESAVCAAVQWAVCAAVEAASRAAIGVVVESAVCAAIEAMDTAVDTAVSLAVNTAVGTAVDLSVDAAAGSWVRAAVESACRAVIRSDLAAPGWTPADHNNLKQVQESTGWSWLGGQFRPGQWGPASTMYMLDVLRLDIGRDLELKARAYAATVKSACYWYPTTRFIFASERPAVIENGGGTWTWRDADGAEQCWTVDGAVRLYRIG